MTVVPRVPASIAALEDLAHNLRWTWHPPTVELFQHVDPARWVGSNRNPVAMLRTTDQAQLDACAADDDFRAGLASVTAELAEYLSGKPAGEPSIAYFSAEFGLIESLPIYAGGLGVLAGDHLKSASDLSLPLVAVGLFYHHGYFQQRLSADGWQEERYPRNEPSQLPLREVVDGHGVPLRIRLEFPGRVVTVKAWHVVVGRVDLYLLDTDVEGNHDNDRQITHHLYGGDRDTRIRQEVVLGIGGIRLLRGLGLRPSVYHLNEGHSAFLSLELIREYVQERGLSFREASLLAGAGMVFTTHTPVAAGHDAFDAGMIDTYFGDFYRQIGLSRSEFFALGRMNPGDEGEPFSLTILALRLAARSNGVSQLHGALSRELWGGVWPNLSRDEAPIGAVTNGVHVPSWIAAPFADVVPPRVDVSGARRTIEDLGDEDLWARHEGLRGDLVYFARARLASQLANRGAGPSEIARAATVLDPNALTIGFARRFAEYKRATLLLRDEERFTRLLTSADRPVQIVFAGKAHPSDGGGKELIRRVYQLAHTPLLRDRVVLLEDYDIGVGRAMVQGCDVWLNTPRRPLEASGTSGMKAAANGALGVSTLDGWWDEAYESGVGWAIGDRRDYDDPEHQDSVECLSLFDVLENEVVPLFYERDANGLPRGWIARMRASMLTVPAYFSTERMVGEYASRYYVPGIEAKRWLDRGDLISAREYADWVDQIVRVWPDVRVLHVDDAGGTVDAGATLSIAASVALGEVDPGHVAVELALGWVNGDGSLFDAAFVPMRDAGPLHEGTRLFISDDLRMERSGHRGYAVRVRPHHPRLGDVPELGLVRWSP
jgi:starch phosphorylase